MPYTGRPRGSGGPVPLLILGVVFGAIGFALMGRAVTGSTGLILLAVGGAMIVGGVAWAIVRMRRRVEQAQTYGQWTGQSVGGWTAPGQPMTPGQQPPVYGAVPPGQPLPNTLSTRGQTTSHSFVHTSVQGGQIDPALLQQLTQLGMAVAEQARAGQFASNASVVVTQPGDPGASVTVQPPVTIDLRNAEQQQIGGGTVPGRATVQLVDDLGSAIEGEQLYELDLFVQPAGRQPFTLKHRVLVPAAAIPRLTVGSSLPVRVDADEPTRIVIDWDAP